MRLNLQQKILAGLLLPTAALFLLFAGFAVFEIRSAEHDVRSYAVRGAAARLATDVTALLLAAADDAQHTAALAQVRPDLPEADFQAWLQGQVARTPVVYGSGVTFWPANYGGRRKDLYVYRSPDGLRRMDESNTYDGTDGTHEWFTLAQRGGQPLWTPPYFDEGAGNVWMVTYSVPFFHGKVFDGVALTDVQLSALGRVVSEKLGNQDWLLLDADGRILHSATARFVGRPYTDWAPASTDRSRFVVEALRGNIEQTALMEWPDGRQLLTGAALIEPMGWRLLLGQQVSTPLVFGVRNYFPGMMSLLAVACLLGFATMHWLTIRQVRPLRQIAGYVAHLATRQTLPVLPSVKSRDEIGDLTRDLTTLTTDLQAHEQHLIARQHELADRVREQQVLYRVADTLGWIDVGFHEMLERVARLLSEAWARPEQIGCRIDLGEYRRTSIGFKETQRGLFAPIQIDSGTGGGVWVFAYDDTSPMEAGQQELLEGVAQQLGLAFHRERAQYQLEKLNRELENRVEMRTDALRKAERLLRDITNSMPGAVYQIVQQPPRPAELRFVSAGVESVMGIPRDRALASFDALMGLVFPDDLSKLNAVVSDAIGRRQAYSHVYRINHGQTGEVRWIRAAANTVVEADGGVLLNGYWIDVTDQKNLEMALENARLEADAANEAKSRFLANMSHEIRTPMNAIIGLTHLANAQTHEPKVRDQLSKVEDAARTLLGLLNDILDFSKIEAGRMNVERIPFDLSRVIDRVQSLMAERAAEKGLLFDVWRVPDLPRDLIGDPLRLNQVLLNLVSNAIKFTSNGSVTLHVTVAKSDADRVSLRFEVQDTGVGIDPIQLARLFSAFTQADNSTTRRFGGTGLGLTICKELISLMGGEIQVDSTPGVGSTFFFVLSFDRADPAWRDEHLDVPGTRSDPLVGARVLLVDDNFINLEVAGELLRQSGVDVVTASNGLEALDKLAPADVRYDAVLMDLQMPEMDGLTATARLRTDPRHADLPVIAMTANAMTGDRERCLAAGMNDHVPKPIDPDELRSTLSRWLRRRQTLDPAITLPPLV